MAASCSLVCCGDEKDSDKVAIGIYIYIYILHNCIVGCYNEDVVVMMSVISFTLRHSQF